MNDDLSPRRKRKTKKQKAAAAGHSRKHRDLQRAAGVPTGQQIDTAIATFCALGAVSPNGLKVTASRLPEFQHRVIQRAGWPIENEAVRMAVAKRMDRLARMREGVAPAGFSIPERGRMVADATPSMSVCSQTS